MDVFHVCQVILRPNRTTPVEILQNPEKNIKESVPSLCTTCLNILRQHRGGFVLLHVAMLHSEATSLKPIKGQEDFPGVSAYSKPALAANSKTALGALQQPRTAMQTVTTIRK